MPYSLGVLAFRKLCGRRSVMIERERCRAVRGQRRIVIEEPTCLTAPACFHHGVVGDAEYLEMRYVAHEVMTERGVPPIEVGHLLCAVGAHLGVRGEALGGGLFLDRGRISSCLALSPSMG